MQRSAHHSLAVCGLATILAAIATGNTCRAGDGILPVPDYSGDIWTRSYLTGDWGGTRDDLANKGFQLDLQWTNYGQSVVHGGRDTDGRFGGKVNLTSSLDLDKMGAVPGGLVKFRAESRYGEWVNDITGTILPANTDLAAPVTSDPTDSVPLAITSLNYTQFLAQQFAVFGGKFDTYDSDPNEFASGRGVSQFMNFNFLFNSASALYPYSTLGAGVLVLPTRDITFSSMIANLVDSSTTTGFDDIGDGWMWANELDCQYRLGRLPGGVNIGGIYASGAEFLELDGRFTYIPGVGFQAPTRDETWMVYLSGWQYLTVKDQDQVDGPVNLTNGRPDHEGLGLFCRAAWADDKTNPTDFTISAGIGGRGMIPGRQDDMYGVGYYYISISDSVIGNILGFDDNSQGVEAFYSLAIARAVALSFDIQYLSSPSPRADDAVAVGLRLNVVF